MSIQVIVPDSAERLSTLHASIYCGGAACMEIAGQLSQRMDDERPASKYQIDTLKRWLKSMSDDIAAYGPGEPS